MSPCKRFHSQVLMHKKLDQHTKIMQIKSYKYTRCIHIGTTFDQQLNNLYMSLPCCHVQWCTCLIQRDNKMNKVRRSGQDSDTSNNCDDIIITYVSILRIDVHTQSDPFLDLFQITTPGCLPNIFFVHVCVVFCFLFFVWF